MPFRFFSIVLLLFRVCYTETHEAQGRRSKACPYQALYPPASQDSTRLHRL